MKGTLHKTESGWQVWYHAKDDLYHGSIRVRILPLHPDAYSVNGPMKDVVTPWEGQEVEFEIVDEIIDLGRHGSTVVEKAKLVDKATRPLTEDNAWPKYPTKQQKLLIELADECFKKYPNNEELYTTDELKDAYKAGVIDGFIEAHNYIPPTKKQDNG